MWIKTSVGNLINVDSITELSIVDMDTHCRLLEKELAEDDYSLVAFTTTSEGLEILRGTKASCELCLQDLIRVCEMKVCVV